MNLEKLATENRNQESLTIDNMSTIEMVQVINNEDKKVAEAVEKELPKIAEAIDKIAERFQNGGRIIYIGAGTSGRLGALDAIELTPTYSVSAEKAFGIMAGGQKAMFEAIEGAEDSEKLAIEDLKNIKLSERDVLIGIAASGRTPYTISALTYGNEKGALTVSVTCNESSEMNKIATVGIAPVVGPEVITGSTRMKAGSAQKMVLNMVSTGVMIKSGKIYQNLMVNVQPTNKKLIQRSINIIHEATGKTHEEAEIYLNNADLDVAVAIVMIESGLEKSEAKKLLVQFNGRISDVLRSLKPNE